MKHEKRQKKISLIFRNPVFLYPMKTVWQDLYNMTYPMKIFNNWNTKLLKYHKNIIEYM